MPMFDCDFETGKFWFEPNIKFSNCKRADIDSIDLLLTSTPTRVQYIYHVYLLSVTFRRIFDIVETKVLPIHLLGFMLWGTNFRPRRKHVLNFACKGYMCVSSCNVAVFKSQSHWVVQILSCTTREFLPRQIMFWERESCVAPEITQDQWKHVVNSRDPRRKTQYDKDQSLLCLSCKWLSDT